eukprot:1144214-Pelagomonas_calceolata.AAC.4
MTPAKLALAWLDIAASPEGALQHQCNGSVEVSSQQTGSVATGVRGLEPFASSQQTESQACFGLTMQHFERSPEAVSRELRACIGTSSAPAPDACKRYL